MKRVGAVLGAIVLGLGDVGRCQALVQAGDFDRQASDRPRLDRVSPDFASSGPTSPDRPLAPTHPAVATPALPLNPPSPDLTAIAPVLLAQSASAAASIDPALLQLWDQGRQDYSAGRYRAALDRWHQALTILPAPLYTGEAYSGDPASLARLQTLNYLAVAYQELGQNQNANEATAAVVTALGDRSQRSPAETLLLAQALNRRGQGELDQGQPTQALATWQQAEATYRAVDNQPGQWGSRLNQARALQALGYYRQAKTQLQALAQDLQPVLAAPSSPAARDRAIDPTNPANSANPAPNQPATALQGGLLRNLGMALESLGELDLAQELLERALGQGSAGQTGQGQGFSSLDRSLTLMSLGNLARTQADFDLALSYYRQAKNENLSPLLHLQIQLNELRLLTQLQQSQAALDLLAELDPQWSALDPSRSKIYARLNFAASLLTLWEQAQTIPPDLPQRVRLSTNLDRNTFSPAQLAQPLVTALTEARSLGDRRAQAQTLTQLSQLYGRLGQWQDVETVASEGLTVAQSLDAPDLIAPLAWQLAQAETVLGDRSIALNHYQIAFAALQRLRSDLLTVNPEVQLTFRDTVEPLYRDYVSLLLDPQANLTQADLQQARQVMEALQIAELDNYFREACLDSQPVALDNLDPKAAIVYPIVLADRLEVIISRPHYPLLHYRQAVSAATVKTTAQQLYNLILNPNQRDFHLGLSQNLYNWLIRPALAELAASSTETLVFIPDSPLRRLPMAVLHDGEHYLLEDYNVVFSPGLQLLPQGSQRSQLSALGVGITIAREGFDSLPGVAQEVDYLASTLNSQVLMDQAFTRTAFTQQLNQQPFSVVHVATHGQFSSDPDQTFLLAWDDRITLDDFDQILAPRKIGAISPIELLVLSACQTAAGDDRAPLGLAGFALKSGARSTLASLWSVSDEATALLMTEFYRNISTDGSPSFAEALRQAQLSQIHSSPYSHPSFWAAFVLVGNWR